MANKYFQFIWVTTLERINRRALYVTMPQRCSGQSGSGSTAYDFNVLKLFINISFLIISAIIFVSCANQLPPNGGDVDRLPPKAVSIIPPNGSINYVNKSITIEFDKYVDRRSFRESLFISPKPKGELDYNWSGKEVTITFANDLEKNRTYVVTIGKQLKDLRQGNTLATPIIFAFSTGNKIDKGQIKGKVFDISSHRTSPEAYKNLLITAYISDNRNINPESLEPDFICPVNNDGSFVFSNLPENHIRLFAIMDNDRNYLFNKDYDNISISEGDLDLSDTTKSSVSNFLMDLSPTYYTQNLLEIWGKSTLTYKGVENTFNKFIDGIYKDSTGKFFSTLKDKDADVPVNPNIFLYIQNDSNKLLTIENTLLSDTATGKVEPLIYKWMNDSLLKVSPQNTLSFGTTYQLSAKNNIKLYFRTIENRKTGNFILNKGINSDYNIYFYLLNKDRFDILYSDELNKSEKKEIKNVNSGTYILFVYLDANGNGMYDRGSYYPYSPSEPFFLRDDIIIKNQWTTEEILKGFF